VTYGVGGSDPCSIVDGKVHLTGVGTCTVTAAQEGNANFNPAPTVSAAANTSSAGAHSATVTGFDQAGNETNANCPYVVTHVFPGFLAPIDASAVNVAKAGQTVPVVWKLADANGAPIADPASFVSVTSTTSTCSPAQATDDVEAYSGGSGLQYLGDGVWQFNWKTAKSYAGQCRTLKLNLADGTVHTAESASSECQDDLISINYTSGTSGRPRGTSWTHRAAYPRALSEVTHARLGARRAGPRPPRRRPGGGRPGSRPAKAVAGPAARPAGTASHAACVRVA